MNSQTAAPSPLFALCPLDGRYQNKMDGLRPLCSEYGLIYFRTSVEVHWLIHLCQQKGLPCALNKQDEKALRDHLVNFSSDSALIVKTHEATTNHDVKAVEYALQAVLTDIARPDLIPWLHFGATSEDINNLAYGLMLKHARDEVIVPCMQTLERNLYDMAMQAKAAPMMARTHGQPASPTTMGKEQINVLARLQSIKKTIASTPIMGKCNGAVGNFNAHAVAFPDLDWLQISRSFIDSLGLTPQPYTTQIEPHDQLAAWLQALSRYNTVLIDWARDTWGYISLGYFQQKPVANEVGSSTMPHKINPIDFENAEGNLGVANAIAQHMANKLPVSRWQRDLSDSTVLRNLGLVLGYSDLAYQALIKGMGKLALDTARLQADVDQHWMLLAEPIQTVLRAHGVPDAYEQLKALSRGQQPSQAAIAQWVADTALPEDAKQRLLALTPAHYTGHAIALCDAYAFDAPD